MSAAAEVMTCLTDMPITGGKSEVVWKVVADLLDSPPITSIDPTQEFTRSEIVSCEMDPLLYIHLLTTDNFPQTEHWDNCHVSYALNS